MPEEKPQSNNSEIQSLKMARESLRRVKEMELSPQQKEEVLKMIDEAKALEKSDPGQALKLYNQLKKKLEDIKAAASGEMEDDLAMKKRQLDILENKLYDINPLWQLEFGSYVKALKKQRELILQPSKLKTEILPDDAVQIDAMVIPKEKEVWTFIKKHQGLSDDDLLLIEKAMDEEGNLLYLKLGVLKYPYTEYIYRLKGSFEFLFGAALTTIDVTDVNVESGQTELTVNIAEYDEETQTWIDKSKNKI